MTYLVQSVIFDKSKFSLDSARTWLQENKYKDKGVDEKKKMWRFRQLNPLTIKRKGYSHYITKPLEHSGVELIIAYKEKIEGAGKLNQIKKALFNHFKKDEKLEKEVATTLAHANKDADELLDIFKQHDKVDDKPQSQIKKQISNLKNKNIRGKGGKLQATEVKLIIDQSYEKKPATNIGEWVLDKDLSTATAKVYYNPRTKEAVVAHRGTQGAKDWGNNVAYALGAYKLTDRYKQGKAIQDKAETKYGKQNISTIGHSQGSILARELGGDTKEIINVNPAYTFEKPKKNEYNIRSEADVVSGLYAPVAKVRSVLYPEFSKKHDITIPSDSVTDVLGNHSADILDKLGDKEIGVGANNNNNNINVFGKGLKKKSSIYSKDNKMTTQEAKLYMQGIMTTGGSLDLSQDLAFRLKYSFKVGELKKMLKELATEGKINLTPKEIRKLKKAEIIEMVVQGKLIDPPELPPKVALAKKFKVADLKKEALEHAKTVDNTKTFLSSIRKLKKADLINYIDLNKLWLVQGQEQEEEQPNIEMDIEEIEEPVVVKKKSKKRKLRIVEEFDIQDEPKAEPTLTESKPTSNPKLQMKGITVGTREMPKEKYVKPDITDEEIALMKRNRFYHFQPFNYPFKKIQDGKIPIHYFYTAVWDNNKQHGMTLVDKRVYIDDENVDNKKKVDMLKAEFNKTLQEARERFAEIDNPTEPKKSKKEKAKKPASKPEPIIINTIEFSDKNGNYFPLNLIIDEDDKYVYYTPDIEYDEEQYADDRELTIYINADGKFNIIKYDKSKKRFKTDEKRESGRRNVSFVKLIIDNGSKPTISSAKDFITNFFNSAKITAPKPAPKAVPVVDEVKIYIIKQYMEKGYNEDEAVEAYKRDMEYEAKLKELQTKENKFIGDVLDEEKPLTTKERGDILEKKFFDKSWSSIKKVSKNKNDKELSVKYSAFIQEIMKKNPKISLPIAKQITFGSFGGFYKAYGEGDAIRDLNKARKDNHYLLHEGIVDFVLPEYKA